MDFYFFQPPTTAPYAPINAIPHPPPGTGWGFVTEGVPKTHPRGLNFWLIPYKSPTCRIPWNTLSIQKPPPLGRESGLKDTLIPTIAWEGGNCIDRCIIICSNAVEGDRALKRENR